MTTFRSDMNVKELIRQIREQGPKFNLCEKCGRFESPVKYSAQLDLWVCWQCFHELTK
jgi:hypothetical protein